MDFAIQKTFSSEEIRRIRKKLNLKQKDFAKFINVSVKTIEHWEKMGGRNKRSRRGAVKHSPGKKLAIGGIGNS